MPPTLILIDGHALAYRSYFALNPAHSPDTRWITSKGEFYCGSVWICQRSTQDF